MSVTFSLVSRSAHIDVSYRMELALQVVGLKMTGKIEDARNIAMRIVSTGDASEGDETSGTMVPNGMMQLAPDMFPLDLRRVLLSRAGVDGNFEKLILNFLTLLDVPVDKVEARDTSYISQPTASGQTLLHLAAFLNFPSLVEFLVVHQIDIDARDKNGYTALAMAAMKGHAECARLLVQAGADKEIVTALGKTPAELAPTGFFDFAQHSASEGEPVREYDNDGDDEASAGEADSGDERVIKNSARDRAHRSSAYRRPALARSKSDVNTDKEQRRQGKSMDNKAMEAGLQDDKQAVASFMDTLQRTLAQLQNPQGMIPNLPMPHLPNLAGMQAWGGLPQMQAVFPVLVPIPALSAIWGDRRAGGDDVQDGAQDDEKGNSAPAWLGRLNAQEWRASWEKWMTQAYAATRNGADLADSPPAYTPRTSDGLEVSLAGEKEVLPSSSSTSVDAPDTVVLFAPGSSAAEPATAAVAEDAGETLRIGRRQSRKMHKKRKCSWDCTSD